MSLSKFIPILLSIVFLFCLFYFRLYHFNLDNLIQNRTLLLQWKDENYFLTVGLFSLLYFIAVAASFPGVFVLSLAGGFLFGPFPGSLYVIFSATLGAVFLYLAVNLAFADWFNRKMEKWVNEIEPRLQKNAFYYLLALRLIPLFPFFVVNIVSGLLALRLPVFISATILGLIPGSLIYTSLGHNLGKLLETKQEHLSAILFQPRFFLPLFFLGFLALLPLFYKRLRS